MEIQVITTFQRSLSFLALYQGVSVVLQWRECMCLTWRSCTIFQIGHWGLNPGHIGKARLFTTDPARELASVSYQTTYYHSIFGAILPILCLYVVKLFESKQTSWTLDCIIAYLLSTNQFQRFNIHDGFLVFLQSACTAHDTVGNSFSN